MSLVTTVKKAVRDRLIARAGGIDLSRLDKVPDSLSWPLQRDAMAPNSRLTASRDEDPVQKLASLLGLEVWLVTGDAESRQVLSDSTSYSTDIRPYMGKSGSVTEGDFGGLGFTDPPGPHPPASPAHAGVHDEAPPASSPGHRADRPAPDRGDRDSGAGDPT